MAAFFLFIGLIFYILICIYSPSQDDYSEQNHIELFLGKTILYIIGGVIFLALGANLFVDGAIFLARYLGISEIVIGMNFFPL